MEVINQLIRIYNNSFYKIAAFLILILFVIAFNLKQGDDFVFNDYFFIIKDQLIKMLVEIGLVLIFINILSEIFQIRILNIFDLKFYYKIILGIWIISHIREGVYLNKNLYNRRYIDKVKNGEYSRTPNMIFKENINYIQVRIEIEQETIGILKALAPISLIAAFINKIPLAMNWNLFIFLFFGVLSWYFYKLWKCNENLKLLKYLKYEFENELSDYLQLPMKHTHKSFKTDLTIPEPETNSNIELTKEPDINN